MLNPYEQTIRGLREELYEARRAIIALMPEGVQAILQSYYSCTSRQDGYRWEGEAADSIVALAEPITPEGPSLSSHRAYCPLCGQGSTTPYESGFALPEGLRWHLLGRGQMRQCSVMGAAVRLARDYWHDKFHAIEEEEAAQKRAHTAQRKKTETLYRIAPDREPELLDEGLSYGATPRNESELVWAEQRLVALGFQVTCEDNVKSYTDEREDFVVYADPRANGEIRFMVCRKPLPKKSRTPRVRTGYATSFFLKDTWKHDIQGKYEIRLAQAAAK